MEFIYLNENDMISAGVCDMKRCIDVMEEMLSLLDAGDYRMSGKTNNDHGARVKFPEHSVIPNMPLAGPDRWFTAMPAYLGGRFHMFGIKSYGSNHKNSELGLPRSILMMQLLDIDTGAPLAYMSANILSAMRTGALAGLGAKWFSQKNVESLGIIGPGVMSRYAFLAIKEARPEIKTVKVLGRGKKNIDTFIGWVKKYSDINVTIVDSVEDACKDVDIIFTGNTRGESFEDNPLIKEEYLKKGCLILASSAVRFYKDFLMNKEKCVCAAEFPPIYEPGFDVDVKTEIEESKKQITYSDHLHNLVCNGKEILSLSSLIRSGGYERDYEKILIYGAYGMPVEDVAWGYECYMNAKKKKLGTVLSVWDEPLL